MKRHLPGLGGVALCGVGGSIAYAVGADCDEGGAYLFDTDGKTVEGCKGCLAIAVSTAVREWRSIQKVRTDEARKTNISTVETFYYANRRPYAETRHYCRNYGASLRRRRRYRRGSERTYQRTLPPQS